jgi:hypothetical protein
MPVARLCLVSGSGVFTGGRATRDPVPRYNLGTRKNREFIEFSQRETPLKGFPFKVLND